MATNYYEADTTIHWGAEPSVWAGYYVSGSSDSCCFTPFQSTQVRDDFEQEVADLLAPMDASRIAPALAMMCGADTESERDWGHALLCEELEYEGFDANSLELMEMLEQRWEDAINAESNHEPSE